MSKGLKVRLIVKSLSWPVHLCSELSRFTNICAQFKRTSNFQPLEVVDHGSETQLQVAVKIHIN